jgi:hypothetical protein
MQIKGVLESYVPSFHCGERVFLGFLNGLEQSRQLSRQRPNEPGDRSPCF